MITVFLPLCTCVTIGLLVCACFVFLRLRSTPAAAPSGPSGPSMSEGGEFKTTGITFFGQSKADDNGIGFVGVDLFKHGTAGLQFNGKPLYPAAVFQGDAAGLLWSVLEVRSDAFKNNKSVYVHIVDVCNSGQSVCKTNRAKHGFLVDIHNTAAQWVGINDGILQGQFRKVGHLKPGSIAPNIWLKPDDYIACSCTGTCSGNDVKWTARGSC